MYLIWNPLYTVPFIGVTSFFWSTFFPPACLPPCFLEVHVLLNPFRDVIYRWNILFFFLTCYMFLSSFRQQGTILKSFIALQVSISFADRSYFPLFIVVCIQGNILIFPLENVASKSQYVISTLLYVETRSRNMINCSASILATIWQNEYTWFHFNGEDQRKYDIHECFRKWPFI